MLHPRQVVASGYCLQADPREGHGTAVHPGPVSMRETSIILLDSKVPPLQIMNHFFQGTISALGLGDSMVGAAIGKVLKILFILFESQK